MRNRAMHGLNVGAMAAVFLFGVASVSASEPVSAEATKYFTRGLAAVEIATVPADFDLAIEEFAKAQAMAPDWPDVYYNLGVVQEKAGKFREAADSLKRYLQLAPDAPNAESLRNLITRLEFKAEQMVTDEVALDIFGSLSDSSRWQLKGTTPGSDPTEIGTMRFSGRDGRQILIVYESGVDGKNVQKIETSRVTPHGRTLGFNTIYFLCSDRSRHEDGCPIFRSFSLDIVSKRYVRMSIKVVSPDIKPYKGTVSNYSYEFVRK
jgi:tetratricopeptide (TPR) repeat protein